MRYPQMGNRGVVILPGVAKPSVSAEYQRGDKMIISHFGSLSDTRSMQPFVEALHLMLQRKPEIRGRLQVHIFGGSIDHAASAAITKYKLEDLIVAHGRLERSANTGLSGREQVLQRMYQADCLLLIHGTISDCREYIPSKLYEYLWTGRPVMALTYQNPQLDQMVRERGGYVAQGDQIEAVLNVIERAFTDWQHNCLPISNIPAIGVQQAVNRIMDEVSKL